MSRDAVPPGVRRSGRLAVNPNVEKASMKLDHILLDDKWYVDGERSQGTFMARALDSAGLLVTPLHERALKACEEYADATNGISGLASWAQRVRDIGRESLAARKAKEPVARYVAREITSNAIHMTSVWDNALKQIAWTGFTEQQARAVAEALNTLEADNGR
jgi:hypothetical protein